MELPVNEDFDVERFFELRIASAEEWQKRNPQPRVVDRHIDTDRPFAIVFTSDWHVGAPGTAHRLLRDDMLRIADEANVMVDLGGDWANNFIIPPLMSAGLADIFPAGEQQKEVLLYIVRPLFESRSVLSIRTGNHDNWLLKVAALDPRWATFGDVPHLCTLDGSIINLHVGDQTYRLYRRHRPRWYSVFNPAHAVVAEYQRNPFEFDIGVIEHEHMSHGADFDGKLRADRSTTRIAIRPGTYKLSDAYADERGYYYSSAEQQVVIFWPDKFQMLRVKGLDLAFDVLRRL